MTSYAKDRECKPWPEADMAGKPLNHWVGPTHISQVQQRAGNQSR